MSMFRAKKLDLGCYINIHIIRDHSKRKTYEQFEPQRCVLVRPWRSEMSSRPSR